MARFYNNRWKPSKTSAREFAKKMDDIGDFVAENGISQSSRGDSYYFDIDGKKYRVSNHSVESSKDIYHPGGRDRDTTYIHASKTRIKDIYNDLKSGWTLDGKGNRKVSPEGKSISEIREEERNRDENITNGINKEIFEEINSGKLRDNLTKEEILAAIPEKYRKKFEPFDYEQLKDLFTSGVISTERLPYDLRKRDWRKMDIPSDAETFRQKYNTRRNIFGLPKWGKGEL